MLSEITPGNQDKRSFDALERQYLGKYIYALRDPRDKKIFYVGQGERSRLFEHFNSAEKRINGKSDGINSKLMKILNIWSSGKDVEWMIITHSLETTENEVANLIESATIDAVSRSQNGPVLNEVAGPHSRFLFPEDLKLIGAESIDPERAYPAVFIFPIHKALDEGKSVYEATRKAWKVKKDYRSIGGAIAVGVKNSVSLGSFKIKGWKKRTKDDRYEFEGEECLELLNKNWEGIISESGFFNFGGYLIVELDGRGNYRFIRGSQDKTWRSLRR